MKLGDPPDAGALRHERTVGDARRPCVVLLPGLLAGGWMWDATWAALSDEGLDAVRLLDPLAAIHATADGVVALRGALLSTLDRLALDRYALCGNSLGGLVALDLAGRVPDRVAAVVISGTPGFEEGRNLGMGAPRTVTRAYLDYLASLLFHDRTRVTPDMLDRTYEVLSERAHVLNVVRGLRAARGYDVRGALERVRCPTLFVWGEHDRVTPLGPWRTAAQLVTRGEFRTVPDAGHSPMIERPEEFNRILMSFLREQLHYAGAKYSGTERRRGERRSGKERRSTLDRRVGVKRPGGPRAGQTDRRSYIPRRSGIDRRSETDRRES